MPTTNQVAKMTFSSSEVKLMKTFENHSFADLDTFLKSASLSYINSNASDDNTATTHNYTNEQKQSLVEVWSKIKSTMNVEEADYDNWDFTNEFFTNHIDEVVTTTRGTVINLSQELDFASLLSNTHTPEEKIVGVGLISGVMEKSDSKYGSTRTEDIKAEQLKRITVTFSIAATSKMLERTYHSFYFEEQSTDFLKQGVDRLDGSGKTDKAGILNVAKQAKIKYPENGKRFVEIGGSFTGDKQNNVEALDVLLSGVYVTFDIFVQKAGETTYALTEEEAKRMCKNRNITFNQHAFNSNKKMLNGKAVVYVYHLSNGLRLSSFATTIEKAQEQAIKNHNKVMERLSNLSLDTQTIEEQSAIENQKLISVIKTFGKIKEFDSEITMEQFAAFYNMVKK